MDPVTLPILGALHVRRFSARHAAVCSSVGFGMGDVCLALFQFPRFVSRQLPGFDALVDARFLIRITLYCGLHLRRRC